jgi:hypothetical protein
MFNPGLADCTFNLNLGLQRHLPSHIAHVSWHLQPLEAKLYAPCQKHALPWKQHAEQGISQDMLVPLLTVLYWLNTGSTGRLGCQDHRKRLSTKQELGLVHYIKVQATTARPALPKEVLKFANKMYISTLPEAIKVDPSDVVPLSIPWRCKFYGQYPGVTGTYTWACKRAHIDGIHPDKVQPCYNVLE